ncbi:NifU family protein [Rhodoblastus acidophilus]|uniref:NifU family protein n=1 Tax=Candidatus Rhodoblastus alkanivorans TaxID=2954117 RepID=A0ABS9Z1U5_9HYPH|nr:NifU family protein [Candidatus Rhodoblastus alkanivorans]MCI4679448.1 NifU family protein [Candidatus Rhodoblastus alkanivorans]MCI4681456.1 NifU family protein [Candidatus Rhodoblastus alkanivorans]MDI4642504.1 NifU family protein [Rhodoblastus acidophilus]
MFIQTESTPNPATLKFLPGGPVLNGSRDFPSARDAKASPLASAIFAIDGVGGVFFGPDFISVTKSSGDWPQLKPAILGAIMEHFMSGEPILTPGAGEADSSPDEFFAPEHAETVSQIKELLETRVRPTVAADGGDIVFRGFKDGTVYLHMKGACSGCPSSTATLKRGVQNLLCHFIAEVKLVEQV